MNTINILNKEKVESLLTMRDVIDCIEDCYVQKSNNQADVYPMIYTEFEEGKSDMDIKAGRLRKSNKYGFKLTSWFSENPKKDLPEIVSVVMVFDDETGKPIGLLDGTAITGLRTGAAGAIGAKYLARKNSKKLLMVGAGNIATYQIAGVLTEFTEIEEVKIYDPMSYEFSKNKCQKIRKILENKFGITNIDNVSFVPVNDFPNAVQDSDIIITATPSRKPLINKEWVKPGTHFSCIGSDMSGKEEIDPYIMEGAKLFVDDVEQCINVGEIEIPIRKGIIAKNDIDGEIGEVICKKVEGRVDDSEITVFDSTGIAVMDISTAQLAFSKAAIKGVGLKAEI